MYTQCPECQIAFRITAEILKQAAGRVRCGGCGNAFNAIEYLSEVPPDPAVAPKPTVPAGDGARRELLEKLDQLAGPEDVRIEDTGIEWRVMDEGSVDDGEAGASPEDTGSIRWFLEDDEAGAKAEADEANDPGTGDTAAHPALDEQAMLDLGAGEDDEPRYDDYTQLPDDFGADDEDETELPPLRRAGDLEPAPAPEFFEAQGDLELGRPEEWLDLLDEVDDDQPSGPGHAAAETPEERKGGDAGADSLPLEVEEELAAIHSELSLRQEPRDRDAAETEEPASTPGDTVLDVGEAGPAADDVILVAGDDATAEEGSAGELVLDVGDADAGKDDLVLLSDDEGEDDLVLLGTDEEPDDKVAGDAIHYAESTGEFERQISEAELALDTGEADDGKAPESDEATAEPATKRPAGDGPAERTPDLPIDEDLLKAMEDQGLAATMTGADGSPLVETIVMEGDFVHDSIAPAEKAEDTTADTKLPETDSLADTYIMNRADFRKGRFGLSSKGALAAVLALFLLLAAQFVHDSRDWLATYGFFNQTVGPMYRLFGKPVTPEWDIRGWQFETTSGSTNDAGDLLTISSRIANRSGQPLPYPLVHVSLTDRWEEIIGSRVLEPNEYLAGNTDPRRPVPPGERFTAVITIESPSAEATGFKLNVCYRIEPGRVRCAIEDFKR